MVKQDLEEDKQDNMPGVKYVKPLRGGRNGFGNRGKSRNSGTHQENLFCPGCFAVSKELKVSIDFKNRPSMCPRTHTVAKFLKAEAHDDEVLEEETLEDYENYGNERPNIRNITEKHSLQNNPLLLACSEEISQQIPNFTFNINVQHDNIESNKTNGRVCTEKQDLNPVIRHVQNLEQRQHLWSSSKIRKETSPRVKALLNHVPFDPNRTT